MTCPLTCCSSPLESLGQAYGDVLRLETHRRFCVLTARSIFASTYKHLLYRAAACRFGLQHPWCIDTLRMCVSKRLKTGYWMLL
jgi:hypothetical protein